MTDSIKGVLAVSDDIPVTKDGATIGRGRLTEDGGIVFTVTDVKVTNALLELPGAGQAFSVRTFDTESRFEQDAECFTKAKPVPNVPWYHKFRK